MPKMMFNGRNYSAPVAAGGSEDGWELEKEIGVGERNVYISGYGVSETLILVHTASNAGFRVRKVFHIPSLYGLCNEFKEIGVCLDMNADDNDRYVWARTGSSAVVLDNETGMQLRVYVKR